MIFLPQLLISGQEPLSDQSLATPADPEADGRESALEKLGSDLDYMLKVAERHLQSSTDDEQVGSEFFRL